MNCPECKVDMQGYNILGQLVYYCKVCDSFWDMTIEMKYPEDCYLHAYGKLGIEWLAFTDATKKELSLMSTSITSFLGKLRNRRK